jgi:hypothetical protein
MTEIRSSSNNASPVAAAKQPDREITPRRLARARQLPLEAREKAAAAVIAEGRSIKASKQLVANIYGVSVAGIDRALNGSRRRRSKIAPKTLADLNDLWQEVFYLAGVKYQSADHQREHFIAFERFIAKWWIDHPEVRDLAAIGSADALHAIAVRGLAALIEAIVGNYTE